MNIIINKFWIVEIPFNWVVYIKYNNGFKFKYMPMELKIIKCLEIKK